MQIVLEDEVKRSNSRRVGIVSSVVCTGRIGGHMERKHDGRVRDRRSGI